jgi:hypothetical protein
MDKMNKIAIALPRPFLIAEDYKIFVGKTRRELREMRRESRLLFFKVKPKPKVDPLINEAAEIA